MNIVLIGMPASGKSTAGVILAKVLGMNFIDSDLIIQKREGALLKEIIKSQGVEGFLKSEERAVLSIDEGNSVIATGGSVVYSDKGMKHLSKYGKVVYLKVNKKELFSRLKNINERGVVLRDKESPEEMFEKRSVLYEKYADIIIDEANLSVEDTVTEICQKLKF